MVEDASRSLSRRPQVSNPNLVKRRELHLERVTLRAVAPAPQGGKQRWRIGPVGTAGAVVVAAGILGAVPLAHAAGPDPIDDIGIVAPAVAAPEVAIVVPPGVDIVGHAVVSAVPEPLARDESLYVKVDGVKDNPYVAARPRLVKRSRELEPPRMSELKANPYEGRGRMTATPGELESNPYE